MLYGMAWWCIGLAIHGLRVHLLVRLCCTSTLGKLFTFVTMQNNLVLRLGRWLQAGLVEDTGSHRWIYNYCDSWAVCLDTWFSCSSFILINHGTMGVPLLSGWPLTWKTWKSQGIPKWSGKSPGKWKKSGKLKFASSVLPLWCNVPFV